MTATLTGVSARQLRKRSRHHESERRIAEELERTSDVPAETVVFTDLVVQ